jgi:flavin-binding protein dodecin
MKSGLRPGCLTREIIGSARSVAEAIRAALEEVAAAGPGTWFEVREIRGAVADDEGLVFQVRLAIGQAIEQ